MKTIQRCESTEPYFVQLIPSESNKGLMYEVHSVMPNDPFNEYVCSCPGFKFNGYCKHQQMAWFDRCLWREDDEEKQTDEERAVQRCPRCGQATIQEELIDD